MTRIGTGRLREQNNQIILNLLLGYLEVTKKELADYSGLTVATVGTILNNFVNTKVVIEDEKVIPKKGRPTKKYKLNPQYFHGLCLFVQRKAGNDYIGWQIIDALGNILKYDLQIIVDLQIEDILSLIKKIIMIDEKIKIIGVGAPAVITNGTIIESDIPNLKGIDLKEMIESATSIITVIKNDMNYTAYGYYLRLVEKKNLCYLTFPKHSGPGCGSMVNGQLLEGENSIAGEIIYLPFFNFLSQHKFEYSPKNVALSLCCIASIINPSIIIMTGEAIQAADLKEIKSICLDYLPKEFMPELIYCGNYEEDYMIGIKETVRTLFIKNNY